MAKRKTVFKRKSRSARQRLRELEEAGKLKRPSSVTFAEETGITPGYIVPGRAIAREAPVSMREQIRMPRERYLQDVQMPQMPQIDPLMRYRQMQQTPYVQDAPQIENIDAGSFMEVFTNNVLTQSLPTSQDLEQRYQETGEPYVVYAGNGLLEYNTGETRRASKYQPIPLSISPSGQVNWSDGVARNTSLSGIQGLSQGLFGRQQYVTAGYMDPEYKKIIGADHGGVDFRTKDLENKDIFFPSQATVVDIRQADGRGTGYGNSVLLKLPTGEMLRLSHLANLGNYQLGQVIYPGTYVGTTGATGNVTGPHLDVEYYNTQGQRTNPAYFSGFTAPEIYGDDAQALAGLSPYSTEEQRQMAQEIYQRSQSEPQFNEQAIENTSEEIRNSDQSYQEPLTDEQLQEVGFKPRAQEEIEGRVLGASTVPGFIGAVIEKETGNKATGLGFTELLMREPKEALKELSRTIEVINPTSKFDLGVSELFRDDMEGSRKVRQDTRRRVGSKVGDFGRKLELPEFGVSEKIAGKDFPKTAIQEPVISATRKFKENIQSPIKKNIEGLKGTASRVINRGLDLFKPSKVDAQEKKVGPYEKVRPEDMARTRAVGEGGVKQVNILGIQPETVQSRQARTDRDIRDPFFRTGAYTAFQQYMKPGAQQQALTTDIFTPDFYADRGRVQSVFGDTYLSNQAMNISDQEIRRREEARRQEARRQEEAKRKQDERKSRSRDRDDDDEKQSFNWEFKKTTDSKEYKPTGTGTAEYWFGKPKRKKKSPINKLLSVFNKTKSLISLFNRLRR